MYLPDLPVSFAFGALIVASHRGDPRASRDESLRQTLRFGALFHCPDSLFAFIWYPDWNLGYLLPWTSVGVVATAALELGLFSMLLLGWWLGAVAVRHGRRLVWIPVGIGFAIFVVVLAAVWDRYTHVGTYAAYHAGLAVPSASDPAFRMFTALAGAYLLVPLGQVLATNALGARP